jgi:hypothetical protein
LVRGYHKKNHQRKNMERERERERESNFPEFEYIDKNNVPNISRVSIQSSGSRWQRYSNHSSVGREIQ